MRGKQSSHLKYLKYREKHFYLSNICILCNTKIYLYKYHCDMFTNIYKVCYIQVGVSGVVPSLITIPILPPSV